jgi:hypothetical protein
MHAQLAVLRQLIESVLHDPLQMTIQTLREDLPTGLPDAGYDDIVGRAYAKPIGAGRLSGRLRRLGAYWPFMSGSPPTAVARRPAPNGYARVAYRGSVALGYQLSNGGHLKWPASCMPDRPGRRLDRVWRRLVCRLPAMTVAGCGLASPGACRRWLPTWLPANSLAALTSHASNKKPTRQAARAASRLGDPGAVLAVDLCRSWNYAESGAV